MSHSGWNSGENTPDLNGAGFFIRGGDASVAGEVSYPKVQDIFLFGLLSRYLFVLTALHDKPSSNHQNQFKTIFGPNIDGIITSPHPEVTLDTFGFLVGAHSTAWRAVIRPQWPK